MGKLVFGVGINDADYQVRPRINGQRHWCPIYRLWYNMLARCYSNSVHLRQPTYMGCTVDSEWLLFSRFRDWVVTQDWRGKQLDKDLIVSGNKVYGPRTCIFIEHRVNSFIRDKVKSDGLPVGVSYKSRDRIYTVTFDKKYIGSFNCAKVAGEVYANLKRNAAIDLAMSCDDRVAKLLLSKYK